MIAHGDERFREDRLSEVGVWYREDTGHIHLSIEGQGFPTVNAIPESKRGNPHLFRKLALMLREAGAVHPQIEDSASEMET